MRRLINSRILGLICLAALAIMPASADIIKYDTTGVFTGSGTNVYSGANNLKITYGDTVGNTVTVPPTSIATFGKFTVTGPTAPFSDTVITNFQLTIDQTNPPS